MAIGKNGILGRLSGAIGTVQGSNWKGRAVYQGRNYGSKLPPTQPQLNMRQDFSSLRLLAHRVSKSSIGFVYGKPRKSMPLYCDVLSLWYQASKPALPSGLNAAFMPAGGMESLGIYINVFTEVDGLFQVFWANNVLYPDGSESAWVSVWIYSKTRDKYYFYPRRTRASMLSLSFFATELVDAGECAWLVFCHDLMGEHWGAQHFASNPNWFTK